MLSRLASRLSPTQKHKLKSIVHRSKLAYVNRFRSYSEDELLDALIGLGVTSGDVLMVHAAFSPLNGFRGSPRGVLTTLERAVGSEGTLVMPSSPYAGTTSAYLKTGKPFDVRRTPSKMGILSEMFRRKRGTTRSLNPAHPILASGPLASWLVAGHETCIYSCGPGSPYEKLVEKDAKALFFDVTLNSLTFLHYLEHIVNDDVPFPLYETDVLDATVIDFDGQTTSFPVRTFGARARTARRFSLFEDELRDRDMLAACRLGNTQLSLIAIRDTLDATKELARDGKYFYDETALSAPKDSLAPTS